MIVASDGGAQAPYRVARARTVAELDEAARVRWAVFSEAMRLSPGLLPAGREINGFDVLDTTDNFVCRRGAETVGTIRLLRPNPAVAAMQALPFGLPIELACRIEGLPPEARVAELGRAAILPAHRGTAAIARLYGAAYAASRAAGITHWVGLSLTETDVVEDAALILAILGAQGRTAAWPRMQARRPAPAHRPCRPFYTEGERRLGAASSQRLPGIVRFLLGIGLSFVGPPVFEPVFEEYVLPILLPLDAFAASAFGRRAIGRRMAAEA